MSGRNSARSFALLGIFTSDQKRPPRGTQTQRRGREEHLRRGARHRSRAVKNSGEMQLELISFAKWFSRSLMDRERASFCLRRTSPPGDGRMEKDGLQRSYIDGDAGPPAGGTFDVNRVGKNVHDGAIRGEESRTLFSRETSNKSDCGDTGRKLPGEHENLARIPAPPTGSGRS